MSSFRVLAAAAGCLAAFAAVPASAAVTVSTSADAPGFAPGYSIVSPSAVAAGGENSVQTTMTVNQQVNAGTTLAQTFETGASGFQLDRIVIYSGGKAGGNVRLNIYPDPVGGTDADGFVNTSFSTDLLNGGAGLEAAVPGSGGLQYITFDLTGADEITLAPNQQYAIEFDILDAAQFSWQRSAATAYGFGNLYSGATEDFNGTPPANNRGQRFQVGGTPQRDAGFALYAVVPEPGSLALVAAAAAAGLLGRHRRQA